MPKKGKSKDKSKKKKGKKGDGSYIAPAIMPPAMFVAVPRTPPPPREPPLFPRGVDSALLNSSLLPRLFGSPEPPADSLSDSSWDDYHDFDRDIIDASYAQVDYGINGQMMPTPPREFRDEYDTDDMVPEIDVMVHREAAEPLYSVVRKPGRGYQDSDDELSPRPGPSRYGDSRYGGGRQGSGRSRNSGRHTPSPGLEESVEAMMVEKQMLAPTESSLRRPPSADEGDDLQKLEQEILNEYGPQDTYEEVLIQQGAPPQYKANLQQGQSDPSLVPPPRRKRSRSQKRKNGKAGKELQQNDKKEKQKPRKTTREGATLLQLLTTSRAATGYNSEEEDCDGGNAQTADHADKADKVDKEAGSGRVTEKPPMGSHAGNYMGEHTGDHSRDHTMHPRDHSGGHTRGHTRDHAGDHTRDHAGDHTRDHTRDHAGDHTRDHAGDHTKDHTGDHTRDHAGDHTRDHTGDHTRDHTRVHTGDHAGISTDCEQRQSPSPERTKQVINLSHTASPKLQSLKEQNAQLLQQQLQIQQQLQQQQQMQQELMQRLQQQGMLASQQPDQASTMDMGSLLQETQSVTDATLQQQSQLIQTHEVRTTVMEQEKHELQQLNEQLQFEIDSLRKLASFRDDDEMAATQTSLLKKQLQDYKEEVHTLKTGIQRVNVELSRYQAKYRPLTGAEKEELPGLPGRGPKPPWLVNTKYLAPLLVSYDDRLKEKDETILQYEREVDGFHQRIEEIIRENQRLHLRIEQSDISGPISMTEWRQLQEQCKLVLEENQLLMEQLDLQQNKSKDMHRAHVQEVTKLSKRLVGAEAESNQLEKQVADLRETYGEIKREHDSVIIENKSKLGVEHHLTTVNELKRDLQEEKTNHVNEVENLSTQIQTLTTEKKGLFLEVSALKDENRQMLAEVRALQKVQRKAQKKMLILQTALEQIESKEHTAEHYLSSVVKMAEQTAMERDTFAQAAHNQNRQKAAAMNRLMQGNVSVGRMEEKLKMYKLKASEKLEKAAYRMKEQDNDFNLQRQEYEREIKHLRLLLREKEEVFSSLAGEKKQIEDDLETMWQVASADNRRMKDTLRKSLRKLQDHTSMRDIMTDMDGDREELIPVSDDEKE